MTERLIAGLFFLYVFYAISSVIHNLISHRRIKCQLNLDPVSTLKRTCGLCLQASPSDDWSISSAFVSFRGQLFYGNLRIVAVSPRTMILLDTSSWRRIHERRFERAKSTWTRVGVHTLREENTNTVVRFRVGWGDREMERMGWLLG